MFPVDDWQFWVVSALALVAALWLIRISPLWTLCLRLTGRKRKAKGSRATLTVGGKPVK